MKPKRPCAICGERKSVAKFCPDCRRDFPEKVARALELLRPRVVETPAPNGRRQLGWKF